jgi:hypothetical protein
MKYLADVPDDEIDKITHLNAMRIFAYDPFPIRPRERCTVEALRAEATDVDLSLMTRSAGGNDRPRGHVALDLSSIGAKSPAGGND